MKPYVRLLSYLRPHRSVLLASVAAIVVFAVLDAFVFVLLIPFVQTVFNPGEASPVRGVLGALLDATVWRWADPDEPLQAVQTVIVVLLVVFILKNIFDFARTYLVARVEQGVTRDLRDQVYDHLLELDLAFFGRTRMGQIVSRVTHDVELVRTLVTRELLRLVSSTFELVAAVYVMVAISWKLTAAAFVVVPGAMVMWGPLVARLRKGDRRILDLVGDVNAHLQETLAGIRLVKTSSAEDRERERFHGLTAEYFRVVLNTERLRALAAPLTEMMAALGTVVLLWYGARLVVLDGSLDGATFVAFLALSIKLYSPVKYASKFPALVQPGVVAGERIFEFLDSPSEIRDSEDSRPFPGLERQIAFEEVSFGYRVDQPVLRDVSVVVPKGTVVALVGPSGAGKTTMVDLLGRFYDVTAGRITVDGTDIREFEIKSLRSALGVVSQETILFHDTVRANIAYGWPGDIDDERIGEAAEAAHAHEFISELPDGYDTVVGERGTELSGGQRQRIAIARALLRDPPILILDEATSALDSEAERLVQHALERLLAGRTVFVIAHRLSTVQRADLTLVLDRGRIVERGTHAELLELGGLYRSLYELQFAAQ
ncbi:MAG: ABC transporter ATP-binding protein [Gemmatimonadota bacterium]|nr:MAG: ABC transporter ATP-binding protein [Gemmatimonadota bacterium]